MRIAILLVRHGRLSPVIPAMLDRLAALGADVQRVYPDEPTAPPSLPEDTRLCVLKAKTPAALRYAAAVHACGIPTLTSYPVTAVCRDKIATTRALEAAGVPVPPTYVESRALALAPLLAQGPLIVKPYRGSQGEGVRVVRDVDELAQVDAGADPVLAQRYLPPDGRDLKIYRIGTQVFCVERPWPPRTFEDKLGRSRPVPDEIRAIAEACGTALGIDLYGVDVILHDGRPLVVDLSSFPGFKGVPDAGRRLGDHILAAAGQAVPV